MGASKSQPTVLFLVSTSGVGSCLAQNEEIMKREQRTRAQSRNSRRRGRRPRCEVQMGRPDKGGSNDKGWESRGSADVIGGRRGVVLLLKLA